MLLDDFHVPSREVMDKHASHLLTGGQVETLFTKHSRYTDHFLLPGGGEWMERAWKIEDDIRRSRKCYDEECLIEPFNWRETILKSIVEEIETPVSRAAHLYMSELLAEVERLEAQNSAAFKRFKTGSASYAVTSDLARQCWFAHWLHKRNAIENIGKRKLAEIDFHSFCIDVYHGFYRLPVRNKIYDKAWFEKIFDAKSVAANRRDYSEEILLSPSIWRLKPQRLHVLIAHRYLTRDKLPPLDPKSFHTHPQNPKGPTNPIQR